MPAFRPSMFRPLRLTELLTKEEIRELYEEALYKPPPILPRATNAGRISKVNKNTLKPKSYVQKFVGKSDNCGRRSANTSKRYTTDLRVTRNKLFPTVPNQKFTRTSTTTFTKKISTNKLSLHSSSSYIKNETSNGVKFTKPPDSSNDLSKINSSGEKEFVELEREYKIKNVKKMKVETDLFQSKIENILVSSEENLNNLKQKFVQLQLEFEDYVVTRAKNRKLVQNLLKTI